MAVERPIGVLIINGSTAGIDFVPLLLSLAAAIRNKKYNRRTGIGAAADTTDDNQITPE